MGDQPVPDEQHDQRADGRHDESRALVGAVMADGLADPGCKEGADDVASLVCFLATPASSNMTGEIVRMDAGLHLA